MQSAIRFVTARRFLALAGVVAIGACSDAATSPAPAGLKNSANGTPGADTTQGTQTEWHLATIRGVVIGAHVLLTADSSSAATTPIGGAKVEIHKMALTSTTSTSGDSASMRPQDLGVVATVTADASGRFEYVLSDPIVVKFGQPSPLITYHLTITPPASSPFAAQSDIQVFFMEQFPAGQTAVNYYLYPRQN